MGAAVEVFEGAQLVEVTRERFLPVKTTNDLLVLRSDCYRLLDSSTLALVEGVEEVPFVDLDSRHYKLVQEFDRRFPDGVPSMHRARSLVVRGDWTFGAGVTVTGTAELDEPGGRVEAGSSIGG
jgi:UTP--glucose-1-phosphate uridylyltransferase